MKKKLLSILFGSLLVLQGSTLAPIKATNDDATPKTPRLMPKSFDCENISPISLGRGHASDFLQLGKSDDEFSLYEEILDKERKKEYQHGKHFSITQKEQIRSYIGNRLIYVYVNPNVSADTPLVIFRAPNGNYAAYRSATPNEDDRSRAIEAMERLENIDIYGIDHLLYFSKDVILDLN